MGVESGERRELRRHERALRRGEAEEEELAGPGGAWPQTGCQAVREQNSREGSGGQPGPSTRPAQCVLGMEQVGPRPTGSILASPPSNSPIIH